MDGLLSFAFFWIVFTFAAAVLANTRGRSAVAWFLIAFLFSPLVAFLFLLVMPNLKTASAQEPDRNSSARQTNPLADEAEKKCPMCAEMVKSEAVICRFCGHEFPEPATPESLGLVRAGDIAKPHDVVACANCGRGTYAGLAVCGRCGEELWVDPDQPRAIGDPKVYKGVRLHQSDGRWFVGKMGFPSKEAALEYIDSSQPP